jgi:hypothetical protein
VASEPRNHHMMIRFPSVAEARWSVLAGVLRRTVPYSGDHWIEIQLGAESLI